MGLCVHEHERNSLTGGDRELAHRRHPLASKLDGRAQDKLAGTGNREKIPIVRPSYPRHGGTIVEADDQLGTHPDGAALADDQTHKMGGLSAQGQEVDQHDFATGRGEAGFQDKGVGPVAARNPNIAVGRRDAPPSVAGVSEKSGKTRRGSQNAANTASRSSRPWTRVRPSRNRRSVRSPQRWRP